MDTTRVLVSGASIAGCTLAYWLHHHGFDVTVVEKAAQVRTGGQAVDLKGPVHRAVLARTGILDDVRAAAVPSPDGVLVDARGRRVGRIPGEFAGGEINVPRGDLARLLHERTTGAVRHLFGDTVTSLAEDHDGVRATFAQHPPETFDLVVGADGMHSRVRSLVFGPEEDHVQHLGYYYVLARLESGGEDAMYNEPGRMAATGAGDDPAFFVFASELLPPVGDDVALQKQQAVAALSGGGWRMPELVARIPDATEFWMDSISRASVEHWSRGRVALVGDAAWGNALGGFGTGLALVGAYVLAGELALARGDHDAAFSAYEERMRGYAAIAEKVNAGRLMAPRTRTGIVARNLLFTTLAAVRPLMRLVDRPARTMDLPDYDALLGRRVGGA